MDELFIDSTRVDANSAWPTESNTILDLLSRIHRSFSLLRKLGLVINLASKVSVLLKELESSAKAIALEMGASGAELKRKKRYRILLKTQKKLVQYFVKAMDRVESKFCLKNVLPSLGLRQQNILEQMRVDLHNVDLCASNAKKRVLGGKKVSPAEKVLGISEPDAEMISKGHRPVVFGYKPQVSRSLLGFILAVEVPPGAASDSSMAVDVVNASMGVTGEIPKVVSFDDGYVSKANISKLKAMGIKTISFSGSKGKAATSKKEWDSRANLRARNKRSMAESTMAVLKRDFGKDRLSRRGIEAVAVELKSVAIFHNIRLTKRIERKNLPKSA